ncbi:MAG TPA: hypothetical protein VHA57_06375 [Actinomycetota bacterium]|nr:hypothetical protein [Actinomycetota bacterium]
MNDVSPTTPPAGGGRSLKRTVLGLCAALLFLASCAAPVADQRTAGVAAADPGGTPVTVLTRGGPHAAGDITPLPVACPNSGQPTGGGVLADVSSGAAPSPTLRLDASMPRDAGGSRGWDAVVAAGGQPEEQARSRSFVLCPDLTTTLQIVTASVPGPRRAGSARTATAVCPDGSLAVGGGGAVGLVHGGTAPRYYFLTGSYPSSPSGAPTTSGTASAWSVVGAIGGMPLTGDRVTAVVLCAPRSPMTVVATRVTGPSGPATAATATTTCPTGTRLLSGGALTGPPAWDRPPQGLHLRGSFPSDESGQPPGNGGAVRSWSALANDGGLPALGTSTVAFALCAGTPGRSGS